MCGLVNYIAVSTGSYITGTGDEADLSCISAEYIARLPGEYPDAVPSRIPSQVGLADAPQETSDMMLTGRRADERPLAEGSTGPDPHLRQMVYPRSLDQQDSAVWMEPGDPLATVRSLKSEESELDIYRAGGGDLASVLPPESNRIVVKQYPAVDGACRSAFPGAISPTFFDLEGASGVCGGNAVLANVHRQAEGA